MKVVICGSMSSCRKMVEIAKELKNLGHVVDLPKYADEYAKGEKVADSEGESIQEKIKDDLIKDYYLKIQKADAVLAVNEEKKGIKGYIGGNTFLEIAFGYVLEKEVYLLNQIPEVSYKSEIVAMQPAVLDGDLTRIK